VKERPYAENDPLQFLAEAMVCGASNAIENQEARGQVHLSTSDVLPIDCNRQDRGVFERMGIVFQEPVDDLFVRVDLPAGWKKVPCNHPMWTDLVDNLGRKRAVIFYKAAFYDRSAHMNALIRLAYMTQPEGGYTDDFAADKLKPRECVVLDAATDGVLWRMVIAPEPPYRACDDDPEARQAWLAWQEKRSYMEFLAEKWLNQNYPDWRDPAAYWANEALGGTAAEASR
jgi:hypothetical protein